MSFEKSYTSSSMGIQLRRSLIVMLLLLAIVLPGSGQVPSDKKETRVTSFLDKVSSHVRLAGFAQMGSKHIFGADVPMSRSKAGDNTLEIRRLCLVANVNVTDRLSVLYTGDFANGYQLLDFAASYRFHDAFRLSFGQQKVPLSMENQLPPFLLESINLSAPITDYLTSGGPYNPLNGVQTGRDIGLMVSGDFIGKLIGYKVGLFNGQGINTRDLDKNKALSGALYIRPISGLEVAGTFYTGALTAVAPAALEADGHKVAAGNTITRDRWTVGAAYTSSNNRYSLRSEYLNGRDDAVRSDGFYVTGKAQLVRNLDLLLSYSRARFNLTQDTKLNVDYYMAALQYWFYPKCRVQVEYNLHNAQVSNGQPSHVLLTQLQVAF